MLIIMRSIMIRLKIIIIIQFISRLIIIIS